MMTNKDFLFYEDKDFTLYKGKMQDVLSTFEENSIDSIVCDPPYELNFMGKGWDSSGVAFQKETWQHCYRVLKPGGYLLAFGGSRTSHRIACAIEDAGFEIRDTIMWLYGCYSKDTQVLTNEGWKYFYELNKNEKIMQFDKDKNELSWVKPLNYFEYDIDDEMVLLENRHTSQLITKDHKVVCDMKKNHKQYKGKYDYIEAQNILKSDCVKLPLASYYYGNLNYEYAYMVGWWLTDAWKHKDGKACMFSQSKPKALEKLRIELERLKTLGKCNYSEYIKQPKSDKHNPEHTFYVTGELADYLLTNFSSREFKEEFIELNKQSKELLLQGLMDGDGSARNNEYSKVFWSQKVSRNDILSALLTTMGYRNYISYSGRHKGVIFNIAHNTTEIQFKHKKPNIKYIGKVYCLQTETGAFVVRRNGKPFISGNSGFPKSMNIGLAIDKKNGVDNRTGNVVKGQGKKDLDNNVYKLGANEKYEERVAQNEWKGYGTALKPAYEPIIVARKPFKGSLVDNILQNGVGGLNIDECRIPTSDDLARINKTDNGMFGVGVGNNNAQKCKEQGIEYGGRFPANVILTYDENDFDEVCGGMPYTKSNGGKTTMSDFSKYKGSMMNTINLKENPSRKDSNYIAPCDSGNASRYFYCAKASKKDRDEGLDLFETKTKVFNGKSNESSEKMKDVEKRFTTQGKNIHPTVKPVELAQYLVRLVSPKGSKVLDCFMGSGSTGKACMFENRERNANYHFIGIEMTDEYLPIAKARIDYAKYKYQYDEIKEKEERKRKGIINIFDLIGDENDR